MIDATKRFTSSQMKKLSEICKDEELIIITQSSDVGYASYFDELKEKLFSKSVYDIVDSEEDIIYIVNDSGEGLFFTGKQFFTFYNNKDKINKLFDFSKKEKIKKEAISYLAKVGVKYKNSNEIIEFKECEADKKYVIEFINKNICRFSIKYFFEEEKEIEIVIKINDLDWKRFEELIEEELVKVKEK